MALGYSEVASAHEAAHDKIAEVYQATYGEPLVADWEWVAPIYFMCLGAVACDPALDPDADSGEEAIRRTVAVIAVMTHGVVSR